MKDNCKAWISLCWADCSLKLSQIRQITSWMKMVNIIMFNCLECGFLQTLKVAACSMHYLDKRYILYMGLLRYAYEYSTGSQHLSSTMLYERQSRETFSCPILERRKISVIMWDLWSRAQLGVEALSSSKREDCCCCCRRPSSAGMHRNERHIGQCSAINFKMCFHLLWSNLEL